MMGAQKVVAIESLPKFYALKGHIDNNTNSSTAITCKMVIGTKNIKIKICHL